MCLSLHDAQTRYNASLHRTNGFFCKLSVILISSNSRYIIKCGRTVDGSATLFAISKIANLSRYETWVSGKKVPLKY